MVFWVGRMKSELHFPMYDGYTVVESSWVEKTFCEKPGDVFRIGENHFLFYGKIPSKTARKVLKASFFAE